VSKVSKAPRKETQRVVLDLERYVPGLITFVSNKLSRGHRSINLGRIARSGSSRTRSRVSVQAPSLPG
jgi:hypothetical protein